MKQLGYFWSSDPYNDDYSRGEAALKYLHTALKAKNQDIPVSFNDFLEIVRKAYWPRNADDAFPGYPLMIYFPKTSENTMKTAIASLGDNIKNIYELDQGEVKASMEALARKTAGELPSLWAGLQWSFKGEMEKIRPLEMTAFIIKESAVEISEITGGAIDFVQSNRNLLITGAVALVGLVVLSKAAPILNLIRGRS